MYTELQHEPSPPAPFSAPARDSQARRYGSGPAPALRVLILDQDPPLRHTCCEFAAAQGFEPVPAANLEEAYAALRFRAVDILLFDSALPGGAVSEFLPAIREMHPETDLVVMTSEPTVSSAVDAMRIGARDYLAKPFAEEDLLGVLQRAARRVQFDLQSRLLRDRLRTEKGMGNLVGSTPEMEKVYRIVSKVAFSSHPVLILGETGTGKELVGRSIHGNGPHSTLPFIPVDCAAIPAPLLEAELFGHTGGALGNGGRARDGLLCSRNGGTVFLDEIAELPLEVQARLLRALQEKDARPVGSTRAVPLLVRILAASSRDLPAMVAQGRFRRDLYFRLNVVNIKLPPLRDRRDDIRMLAQYFLERIEAQTGISHMFSADAMRAMTHYDWPGNVRELENAIERACALTSGPMLHTADLPTQLQNFRMHAYIPSPAGAPKQKAGKVLSMAEVERQAIIETIRQVKGDKIIAARLLGIGKTTLYRKLKEYGVSRGEMKA